MKETLVLVLKQALEKEMHFHLTSMTLLKKEYLLKEIVDMKWIEFLPQYSERQLIENELFIDICIQFSYSKTMGSLVDKLYAFTKNIKVKFNLEKQDFEIAFSEKINLGYGYFNTEKQVIEIIEIK